MVFKRITRGNIIVDETGRRLLVLEPDIFSYGSGCTSQHKVAVLNTASSTQLEIIFVSNSARYTVAADIFELIRDIEFVKPKRQLTPLEQAAAEQADIKRRIAVLESK
jgi:hypothetical protein